LILMAKKKLSLQKTASSVSTTPTGASAPVDHFSPRRKVGAKQLRIGIVWSEFNSEITKPMLKEAIAHAKKMGAQVKAVIKVPGAFETPFAAQKLLSRKDIDAVAVVGAVIKGETKHDVAIMCGITKGLIFLQLKHKKPVGLGISGPGVTWKQAKARINDYAHRSLDAAIWMSKL